MGSEGSFLARLGFFLRKKIQSSWGVGPNVHLQNMAGRGWQTKSLFETLGKEWGVNRGSRTPGQCLVAFWAGAFHEVASSNSSLAGGMRGQCKGWQSLSLDR